jgi:hypothetical protein
VASASVVYVVNGDGQLFTWNGTDWDQIPLSFAASSSLDAIAATDGNSLAVLDTSDGIHLYNSTGSGVWSTIVDHGHRLRHRAGRSLRSLLCSFQR